MNYTFESIAGYEQEKEELMRLCEIFNNREKYEGKGAKLPKGIVFYGGTGTGKTLFAKVMASTCGLEVFKIDLGDVESDVTICRRIRKEFTKASKRKEPTMIFFDEVDKVLPDRYEEYVTDRSKTILAQLLTLIDGMDSAGNIVFIATCNDYDALPETLTRPGRIDKKIRIGNPTLSSREAILKMYADRSSCQFALAMDEIAKLTNGFSCAGLETLVNECILQSDENGFVSEKLIHDHISEIKAEDRTVNWTEFERVLDSWFEGVLGERYEEKRIANPDECDKILLNVIYFQIFKAGEQLSEERFDIEHLATKGILRSYLDAINKSKPDSEKLKLPISSFGNICYLPETDNRSKGKKTLYQDTTYLSNRSLEEIETKYSLTKHEDMEWLEVPSYDRETLKMKYLEFVRKRWERQKEKIKDCLYGENGQQ